MLAGLPLDVGSHTVTQACISANQAITTAAEKICAGEADVVIAGGCETFSDVPIRYSKPIRSRLLKVGKAGKAGIPGYLKLLKGLKLKDLAVEAPAIANYTTNEVMGMSSERLSAKFGVTRQDMDEFTVLSHTRAAAAHANGKCPHLYCPTITSSHNCHVITFSLMCCNQVYIRMKSVPLTVMNLKMVSKVIPIWKKYLN